MYVLFCLPTYCQRLLKTPIRKRPILGLNLYKIGRGLNRTSTKFVRGLGINYLQDMSSNMDWLWIGLKV